MKLCHPLKFALAERADNSGRAGATLTEVLMAILIMAVGVVSVFTLFPITVLRTIQATNQTNARIFKENVEEQLTQSPELLTVFSASTNAAPASPLNGLTMRGEWQPGVNYAATDVVIPTNKAGGAIPRPLAFFTPGTPGISGLVEPVWNSQATSIPDGGATWVPFGLTRYVVDPLGWNLATGDGQSAIVVDTFGNKTNKVTGVPSSPFTANRLIRINGSLNTPLRASDTCTHPDTWQQLLQATPTNVTATSVTFPGSIDLTDASGSALAAPRIVLTSLDGRQSVVRRLTSIAAPTVSWATTEPLPARFPAGNVGTARIEIFNRRYAWFMTVRNVAERPEIKCVVTFNRSGAPAEEHAYAANFGNTGADLDGDGNADSTQGLIANNQVMVAWQPGAATAWDPEGTGAYSNEPDPLLKAGNWLFDARDVSWYRIQSVDASSSTTATPRWSVLSLDRTARVTTPSGAGTPPPPNPPGRAILMPGIVDVFDL